MAANKPPLCALGWQIWSWQRFGRHDFPGESMKEYGGQKGSFLWSVRVGQLKWEGRLSSQVESL